MKRDYSLDLMRAISMLCVIVIHFSNYYCRAFKSVDEITYLGGVVFNALARISVPIFFMISGALLIGGKHDKKKYWDRIIKLVWALVIWNIIYYAWNYFYMGTSTPFFKTIITALFQPTKAHLWFMYAIIGLYLILPFAQAMFQNMDKEKEDLFIKLWLFFSGIVFLSRVFLRLAGITTDLEYNVPLVQGTYYFGYFAVGYILYKRFEEYKPGLNKWLVASFVGSTAITIGCCFLFSMGAERYYGSFFGYRSALIIIAALSVFMLVLNNKQKICDNKGIIKFVSVVAPASFGIYLFHIIPFNILIKNISVLEINPFVGIPFLSLAIALISFIVVFIVRKIPGCSKLLGI